MKTKPLQFSDCEHRQIEGQDECLECGKNLSEPSKEEMAIFFRDSTPTTGERATGNLPNKKRNFEKELEGSISPPPYVFNPSKECFNGDGKHPSKEEDWIENFKLWAFYEGDAEKALTGIQAKSVVEYFSPLLQTKRESIKTEIKNLIAEEMLIAHKENTPTSRLTALSNKISNL
jgi:hypothetical protein